VPAESLCWATLFGFRVSPSDSNSNSDESAPDYLEMLDRLREQIEEAKKAILEAPEREPPAPIKPS
jgi:hypothetical protein